MLSSISKCAIVTTLLGTPIVMSLGGCGGSAAPTGIQPQSMADALHAVMASDRTIYTKKVVNRLVKQDKVIKASEQWQDDQALPLPAQMFRMGAELVAESTDEFSYGLISSWPINQQHAPKTDSEKAGLAHIEGTGENYYGEETLGGQKYFTAIYPDKGVAAACVDCHNEHQDSPKTDFKLGDVMGGVIIRIPID